MRTEVTRWNDGSLQILLHLTPEELGKLKQQDGTESITLDDPTKGVILGLPKKNQPDPKPEDEDNEEESDENE